MTAEPASIEVTPSFVASEMIACRASFWYWLQTYTTVEHKKSGRRIPFQPYPGQVRIARRLLVGQWPWLVKARRLGATIIGLSYICWKLRFWPHKRAVVISQTELTAKEILGFYDDLDSSQPDWLRSERTTDATQKIAYPNGSSIVVRVGNEKAARSEAVDIALVDEASFIPMLLDALSGIQPSVEESGGVMMVCSTTKRPAGGASAVSYMEFKAGYEFARQGRTKYTPMFLGWWERPDRTQAWHDEEARANSHIPGYMQREYPSNDQECFEMAGNRVYPGFTRDRNIVSCEPPDDSPVPLYRAVDFGNTVHHPFVCLWAWHDSLADPRLTVEPDSTDIYCSDAVYGKFQEGPDQMFAYRRNPESSALIKMHDDWPDALRYLITHYRLTGHVHIYRTLVIRCDDDFEMSPADMFRIVQEMSGMELTNPATNTWKRTDDTEDYAGSVCDRHDSGWLRFLRQQHGPLGYGMNIVGNQKPEAFTKEEVEQGIVWVSALILGNAPFRMTEQTDAKTRAHRWYAQGGRPRNDAERLRHLVWDATARKKQQSSGKRVIW